MLFQKFQSLCHIVFLLNTHSQGYCMIRCRQDLNLLHYSNNIQIYSDHFYSSHKSNQEQYLPVGHPDLSLLLYHVYKCKIKIF